MALNNFVAAPQLPKWARRGTFREGGSYEGPAEMAKAILSGRWNFTPEQLHRRVKAYDGNDLIDRMKKNHVTMVRLVWSPGFSHKGDQIQWQIMRDVIRRAHRKGLKVIAYHSVTNSFWQEMFEAEPASRGWRQVNHEGKDVPYMAASYGGIVTRVLMCVNQQPWREYVKYKIAQALEAGADGLFFDNLFSRCFCPVCREKFAQYTEQLYGRRHEMPAPEPAQAPRDAGDKSGIEIVADSERHRSEMRSTLSLARDQFWNNSVADMMREFWEHALRLKGDVLFEPNGHERWPMNLYCNLKLSEDQQPCTWTAGGATWMNVALWKYLYEDGGREKPAVNGARDKVMWAEMLAFGCDPIGAVDARYAAWHAQYGRKVYADVQPAGRVGLLMRSLSPIPEKSPAVTLLARANVQFDIIVYEMLAERYDLSRYEVLLANDVRFMSHEACERVRRFVRDGGTLIATGQTSLFTEKWEPRGDYGLADLFGVAYRPDLTGRFEQAFGPGRVILWPASVQDAAFKNENPQLLRQWLDDVAAAQKRPALKVEAPDGVLVSVWQRHTGRQAARGTQGTGGQAGLVGQRIVHLVNYRGEPARDVRLTVADARRAKVELLSPDEGVDLTARDVAAGADGVTFVVPAVAVYTVAVVG